MTAIRLFGRGGHLYPRADGQRRHHRRRLWATVGWASRGAGLYVTGGVATVLIVLFQVILHRSSPLVKTQRTGTVVLELSEAESDPAEVRRLLEERVSAVEGVRVTRLADGRQR